MSASITNSLTNRPLNTLTGGASTATGSTHSKESALADVFEELASALGQPSQGNSSLVSQGGGQSNQPLGQSADGILQEFAAALVDLVEKSAGSSNTASVGASSNTNTSSATGTTTTTGNNSNTSATFSASVLPAKSADASSFTQAGASAISNMPAATFAKVNINDYVSGAQTAMASAGYSQTQISTLMTGLDQGYAQRHTLPASSGSSTTSGGTSKTYNPAEQQHALQLEQHS